MKLSKVQKALKARDMWGCSGAKFRRRCAAGCASIKGRNIKLNAWLNIGG